MAALYDEVCLKTFPADSDVDALMAKKAAAPLPAEDVKVSLGNDPGRGWTVKDGNHAFMVLLELPPFHACSVRASPGSLGGKPDLTAYHSVVEAFKAMHKGFVTQPSVNADRGGIHMHAELDARTLPDGSGELLIAIDQQIIDSSRLPSGQTATPLRFVHQIKAAN